MFGFFLTLLIIDALLLSVWSCQAGQAAGWPRWAAAAPRPSSGPAGRDVPDPVDVVAQGAFRSSRCS
jgi:hypothetical protein